MVGDLVIKAIVLIKFQENPMKTKRQVAKKQPNLVRKILSKFTKIPNFAESAN